jgi:hypothetical protein
LKSILTNLAFLIVVCKLVTILASDFVDWIGAKVEIVVCSFELSFIVVTT